MFPKIIIFALQQIKIFQNQPLSKIRIFWKNIHPCSQENEEPEEEVLTQLDESVIEEVITDYNSGDPAQLGQEDVGITLDDSFMEDANRDYNSNRNTQDDSIDALLNITITIIDDPITDDVPEEHEVIHLTTGLADPKVSSVFPSSNETVDEEICPVCHDTFKNIEKERKTTR